MKKLFVAFILAVFTLNSGCVSYYAHKNWKEAQEKKAVRVEADGEQVLVGVDLTQMTYLKDNWKIALGAGVVDAVLIYYTYDWVDSLNDGNSSSSSGNRNNSVSVSGNSESSISINISGDTTTDTRNDNDNSNNSFY